MNEGFEFTLHASSSPAFDRFFAGFSSCRAPTSQSCRAREVAGAGVGRVGGSVAWVWCEEGGGREAGEEPRWFEEREREREPVGGGGFCVVPREGEGEEEIRGVKLRFCPSLISIVYATVPTLTLLV